MGRTRARWSRATTRGQRSNAPPRASLRSAKSSTPPPEARAPGPAWVSARSVRRLLGRRSQAPQSLSQSAEARGRFRTMFHPRRSRLLIQSSAVARIRRLCIGSHAGRVDVGANLIASVPARPLLNRSVERSSNAVRVWRRVGAQGRSPACYWMPSRTRSAFLRPIPARRHDSPIQSSTVSLGTELSSVAVFQCFLFM